MFITELPTFENESENLWELNNDTENALVFCTRFLRRFLTIINERISKRLRLHSFSLDFKKSHFVTQFLRYFFLNTTASAT